MVVKVLCISLSGNLYETKKTMCACSLIILQEKNNTKIKSVDMYSCF